MSVRITQAELHQLYEQCGPSAHRRARQLLGSADEAWDAVHDVFTKVADQGLNLRNASPTTFFYRAITNHCLNRLEARATRTRHADQTAETQDDTETSTEALMARNLLVKLAPELDDLDRQIIVLYCYDRLSQEEVAQVTGKRRRQIGQRLKRIRELAEALSEPVPEEGVR